MSLIIGDIRDQVLVAHVNWDLSIFVKELSMRNTFEGNGWEVGILVRHNIHVGVPV